MKRIRRAAGVVVNGWRDARLSRVALGKYIILFASVLHLAWATLLLVSPDAGGSTPVAVVVLVCGGQYRAAFVLAVTSLMGISYLFIRREVTNGVLATLLLPQQFILLMSAGAGIYATWVQHYADGVARGWAFILSDQLPIVLLAGLYTIAVLEAAFEPVEREFPPREDP